MASATYTTGKTFVAGDVLTASEMNTYVTANINAAFGSKAELRVRRAANQSIPNNTPTAISWDTEDTDTDGFIAVTSSTITIPAGFGGIYVISAYLDDGNAAVARKYSEIVAGGNTWRSGHYGEQGAVVTVATRLAATDTVVVNRYQNSGGALNTTGRLEMNRIGI